MEGTTNQKIAYYRKLCGYTQVQIAEILNMKPSTYAQLERKGKVNVDVLLKISEILKLEPQLLLEDKAPTKLIKPKENKIDEKKTEDKKETNLTAWEMNFLKVLNYIPHKKRTELLKLSILVLDNPRKIKIEEIVKQAEQINGIRKSYSD